MKISQTLSRLYALGAVLWLAALLLWPAAPAFAAPPAGTNISNQASATYTDGNSVSRSTTSNAVITTVAQVRAFTLSTDAQSRNAAPGQTVYFSHSIVNTGNGQDTYNLTAATGGTTSIFNGSVTFYMDANGDGIPDNATPITSLTIPAFAAQPTRFVAAVVIGGAATSGQSATLAVTAKDNAGAGATSTNTDTVTISNAAIAVTKSLSTYSGPAGQTGITVTLAYSNSGTAAATNLVLTDVLPSGMTFESNKAQWSVSGSTLLLDGGSNSPSGLTYSYTPGSKTVSATVASVAAGSSGQLTFLVDIGAGLSPTNAAMGASCTVAGCPALTTNTASFQYTVGATTTTSTPTNSVTYSVAQTAGVAFNGSSTVGTPGTGLPLLVASASQGSIVTFTGYVWNNGNGVDTFNISNLANNFPGGTTFQFYKADGSTPLSDTNSDGTPDTGPLGVGGSTAIVIKALLPTAAAGNNSGSGWTATFDAKSTYNALVKDTLNNIKLSNIVINSVDMTVNAAVGGASPLAVGAGTASGLTQNVTPQSASSTPTAFKVYVNNTAVAGGAADTYNLSATGLPSGWSAAFYADGGAGTCASLGTAITNTGSIAQGGNKLVCYVVSVPSIASANAGPQTPLFTLTATSGSTGNADTTTVTVAVPAVNNVTLTPTGNQQTYAGSAVTYAHALANLGNVSQTVTFASAFLSDAQAVAGWTSVAYVDTNNNGVLDVGTDVVISTSTSISLAVAGTQTVFVRVFAPGSVTSASPADVTTLTATYATTTTSTTDTTTITDGLLLNKQHVATSCSTTPSSGWTTNPYNGTVSGFNPIAPGNCIAYLITGTNTTANPITSITVNDGTPANTTLNTSCGAPTASSGFSVVGAPANGGTGTFTVTGASLAPGSFFTVQFCVKINP